MSNSVKTIYRLELDFKSPLHVGKGSQGDYLGAAEIIHDGSGKFILPGSSVAGVFFSTMQKCISGNGISEDKAELWKENVSLGPNRKDEDNQASRFVFRTATLNVNELKVRDKVRINRKTKTAEENAKFSLWEIDPGRVKLLIEIDNLSRGEELGEDDFASLENWAEAVFHSWQREGVFFGGHSGTGNGYGRLLKVEKFSLNTENLSQYLESSYQDMLEKNELWSEYELPEFEHCVPIVLKRYACTVKTGLQNPLLIKGGSAYQSETNPETDSAFISRHGKPFIPGSSFRGALSSFMDKYDPTEWKTLLGQPQKEGQVPKHGGCLIFTDLHLDEHESSQMALVQIERHAEDQFSRAIFEGSKFIEERLFNAVFKGEIIVLACETAKNAELEHLFGVLKVACEHSLISLGSGAGHPEIELEEIQ